MRPVHISYDEKSNCLFASSNRGTILRFNENMVLQAVSQPVYNLNNLYVMILDEDFVYARDISGKLVRWRKDTLALDTIIDLCNWSDPEVADVPNVSHGLFIRNSMVYVAMPQGRIGKFSQSDLSFQGLSGYLPKALIECVEFAGPQGHFAVDFSGYLYQGDIDELLRPVSRVANGACHQIIYDKRFDRYWITDDFHCGLALFKAKDPKNIQRIGLTNDDVEWMSFSEDQSQVLVACFDRYVYRLSNEENPKVIDKIGPFKYQVNHVTWVSQNKAYALTESGEIYRFDPESGVLTTGPTGTNSVWDIQPSGASGRFWVGFEDGIVRQVEVSGMQIKTIKERQLELGMVRRVLSHEDQGVFALTTSGHVARLDQDLEVKWLHETKPLLRDFARRDGMLLFCSERGELTCLEENSGRVIWRKEFAVPLWSVAIDPEARRYWVASRLCERGDQGCETSGKPAPVMIGDLATGEVVRRESIFGNIKRMKWVDEEHILINGNGEVATSLMRESDFTVIKRWNQWQLNTCEATLIHNSKLYTTTYGYQLNTFDLGGEILESAFPFEDYATALSAVDDNHILAGGRGAFLSLFSLRVGLPVLAVTKRFQ